MRSFTDRQNFVVREGFDGLWRGCDDTHDRVLRVAVRTCGRTQGRLPVSGPVVLVMSGELILSIGYGGILFLCGVFAYWWTKRSYGKRHEGPDQRS